MAWRRLTLLTIASWPPRTSFAAVAFGQRRHMHRPEDPYPFCRRSFSAAVPQIEQMPPELRRPDSELGEFRRSLKTLVCLGTAEMPAH